MKNQNNQQIDQTQTNLCRQKINLSLSSSLFSTSLFLPVHSHYLYGHMLAAFWEWYAKSGGEVLGRPALPPTLHLSSFLRTRAIQRPALTFELWECSFGSSRCCKRRLAAPLPPSLSQFTPVLPVALLSWCCAPALLVSAAGFLSRLWSLGPSPNRSSCVAMATQRLVRREERFEGSWWQGIDLDLGMMNTFINGRSKCTLPFYRLCKV